MPTDVTPGPFEPDVPIKVIGKAGQVIRVFLSQGPELQLQQIAEASGLDMSTTSRIVTSLTGIGVLRFDAVQRLYSPGLMLLELSHSVLSRFGFRELAHRELLALSSERGWACFMGMPDEEEQDHLIYIEVVSTAPRVTVRTEVGQRRAATSTASGMVLLAFGLIDPAPFIAAEQPADKGTLEAALAGVRRSGVAVVVDEGFAGVAAPLWNANGSVVATLGAEVARDAFEADRDAVIDVVRAKANGISSALALSATQDLAAQYSRGSNNVVNAILSGR